MKKKPKAREVSGIKAEILTKDLGINSYNAHKNRGIGPLLMDHGTKLSL